MGETCGLKLVYETRVERDACRLCVDMEKKQRRYDKMLRDVQRWQREGNRSATIERTTAEMEDVAGQISRLRAEHDQRLLTLGQVVRNPFFLLYFPLLPPALSSFFSPSHGPTFFTQTHILFISLCPSLFPRQREPGSREKAYQTPTTSARACVREQLGAEWNRG